MRRMIRRLIAGVDALDSYDGYEVRIQKMMRRLH